MLELSVRVKFKATPDMPRWRHRRASIERGVPFGSGSTTRLRPQVVLTDGDLITMSEWEAAWATTHYPSNFEILEPPVDPHSPTFDLEACSYTQLQVAARILGVSAVGKADDVKSRIRAKLSSKKNKSGIGDS